MYSKIIKNGTIIDGTGKPAYRADLAIEGNRIVEIGDLANARAEEIIDAQGKYVAPGFIDIQNHSDAYWTIFDNPSFDSMVTQGITTAIVGNCGASLAPLLSRDAILSVQKWHNLEGVNINWLSFKEYLDAIEKKGSAINIGSMVGYSTLRRGLMQDNIRALTEEEIKILQKVLKKSFDEGAFGLSSGLSYAHEAIISVSELLALAQTVKDEDRLLSVHLRSEGEVLTESVAEALELVSKTGVSLKISHFKVRDRSNWPRLQHALDLIENSYQKHAKILFDLYPYDTMWNVLYTYLPGWSYEGGRNAMLRHLKDPTQRKKILGYLMSKDVNYAELSIASTTVPIRISGKKIGELAARNNTTSEETLLTLLENGGSEVLVFDKNLDQKQVDQLTNHALSIISTDGAGFSINTKDKVVHPRCFGAMSKFLSEVIANKQITLEEAVKKITSTPAEKMGIVGRGQIAIDYFADVVIFDDTISSNATYENPYQYSRGIDQVLVNGYTVVRQNVLSSGMHGTVLRKK